MLCLGIESFKLWFTITSLSINNSSILDKLKIFLFTSSPTSSFRGPEFSTGIRIDNFVCQVRSNTRAIKWVSLPRTTRVIIRIFKAFTSIRELKGSFLGVKSSHVFGINKCVIMIQ